MLNSNVENDEVSKHSFDVLYPKKFSISDFTENVKFCIQRSKRADDGLAASSLLRLGL